MSQIIYYSPISSTAWPNLGTLGSGYNAHAVGANHYGACFNGTPYWGPFGSGDAICLPSGSGINNLHTVSFAIGFQYQTAQSSYTALYDKQDNTFGIGINGQTIQVMRFTSNGGWYSYLTPDVLNTQRDYYLQVSWNLGATPSARNTPVIYISENGAWPTKLNVTGGQSTSPAPNNVWMDDTGVATLGNLSSGTTTCGVSNPGSYNLKGSIYVFRMYNDIENWTDAWHGMWYIDRMHRNNAGSPPVSYQSIKYDTWPTTGGNITDTGSTGNYEAYGHYADYAVLNTDYSQWNFWAQDDYIFTPYQQEPSSAIADVDQFTMEIAFYLRGYSYSGTPRLFSKAVSATAETMAWLDTSGYVWLARQTTDNWPDVWQSTLQVNTGEWNEVQISWKCGTGPNVTPYAAPVIVVNGTADLSAMRQQLGTGDWRYDGASSLVIGQRDGALGLNQGLDADITIFRWYNQTTSVSTLGQRAATDALRWKISTTPVSSSETVTLSITESHHQHVNVSRSEFINVPIAEHPNVYTVGGNKHVSSVETLPLSVSETTGGITSIHTLLTSTEDLILNFQEIATANTTQDTIVASIESVGLSLQETSGASSTDVTFICATETIPISVNEAPTVGLESTEVITLTIDDSTHFPSVSSTETVILNIHETNRLTSATSSVEATEGITLVITEFADVNIIPLPPTTPPDTVPYTLEVRQKSKGWQLATGCGPAACVWGGSEYAFMQNSGGTLIEITKKDEWASFLELGGIVAKSVATAGTTDALFLVARGEGDGACWYTSSADGILWADWVSLGGQVQPNTGPGVCASGSRIDVFVSGTDGHLYYKTSTDDGVTWPSGWTNLGGVMTSGPAATTTALGVINVFCRGTDGQAWTRTTANGGTTWASWHPLGGKISPTTSPAVCSYGTSIDLFAVGMDAALYQLRYTVAAGWDKSWTGLQGKITATPAAISLSTTELQITVFARGTDDALWYRYWNSVSWTGWIRVGTAVKYDLLGVIDSHIAPQIQQEIGVADNLTFNMMLDDPKADLVTGNTNDVEIWYYGRDAEFKQAYVLQKVEAYGDLGGVQGTGGSTLGSGSGYNLLVTADGPEEYLNRYEVSYTYKSNQRMTSQVVADISANAIADGVITSIYVDPALDMPLDLDLSWETIKTGCDKIIQQTGGFLRVYIPPFDPTKRILAMAPNFAAIANALSSSNAQTDAVIVYNFFPDSGNLVPNNGGLAGSDAAGTTQLNDYFELNNGAPAWKMGPEEDHIRIPSSSYIDDMIDATFQFIFSVDGVGLSDNAPLYAKLQTFGSFAIFFDTTNHWFVIARGTSDNTEDVYRTGPSVITEGNWYYAQVVLSSIAGSATAPILYLNNVQVPLVHTTPGVTGTWDYDTGQDAFIGNSPSLEDNAVITLSMFKLHSAALSRAQCTSEYNLNKWLVNPTAYDNAQVAYDKWPESGTTILNDGIGGSDFKGTAYQQDYATLPALQSKRPKPKLGATPISYQVCLPPSAINDGQIQYFAYMGYDTCLLLANDPNDNYATEKAIIESYGMTAMLDMENIVSTAYPINGYHDWFAMMMAAGWQYGAAETGRIGDPAFVKAYLHGGYINYNQVGGGLWKDIYVEDGVYLNAWECYNDSEVQYIQTGAKAAHVKGIKNGLTMDCGGVTPMLTLSLQGIAPTYKTVFDWSYQNSIGFTSFLAWFPHTYGSDVVTGQYVWWRYDAVVEEMMATYSPSGTWEPTVDTVLCTLNRLTVKKDPLTFSGQLVTGTDFSAVPNAVIELQVSPGATAPNYNNPGTNWQTVATTQTNGSGNWTISYQTVPGNYLLRLYYAGDATHMERYTPHPAGEMYTIRLPMEYGMWTFSGTDDCIKIPHGGPIDNIASESLEFLFYLNGTGGGGVGRLWSKLQEVGSYDVYIKSNYLIIQRTASNGDVVAWRTADNTFPISNWYYLQVVWSGGPSAKPVVYLAGSSIPVTQTSKSTAASWGTDTWQVAAGTGAGVCSWGSDRQDVFVVGSDGSVYHTWDAGDTGLLDIESLGGAVSATPAATSPAVNTLYVFARGGSGILYWKKWNGTSWTAWGGFADTLAVGAGPAACSYGSRVDAFYEGTNGHLYQKTSTNAGSTWGSGTQLTPTITATPTAITTAAGHISVFARGSDGALWWMRTTDGSTWGTWTSIGGAIAAGTGPSAVILSDGTIYVFMEGTDSACWYIVYDGSIWGEWNALGGVLSASPAVLSKDGISNLTVYVRGSDATLWYITSDDEGVMWGEWKTAGGFDAYLGNIAAGGDNLDGSLALFRLYNEALDAGQCMNNYCADFWILNGAYQSTYTISSPPLITFGKNATGVDVQYDYSPIITKLYPRGAGSTPGEMTLNAPSYYLPVQKLKYQKQVGEYVYFTVPGTDYTSYDGFAAGVTPQSTGMYIGEGIGTLSSYNAWKPVPDPHWATDKDKNSTYHDWAFGAGAQSGGYNSVSAQPFIVPIGGAQIPSISLRLWREGGGGPSPGTPDYNATITSIGQGSKFIVGVYSSIANKSGSLVPYQGPLIWYIGDLYSIASDNFRWYTFPMQGAHLPAGYYWIVLSVYPSTSVWQFDYLWWGGYTDAKMSSWAAFSASGIQKDAWLLWGPMGQAIYKNFNADYIVNKVATDVSNQFFFVDERTIGMEAKDWVSWENYYVHYKLASYLTAWDTIDKYGVIEGTYKDSTITTQDALLKSGGQYLTKVAQPVLSWSTGVIDLYDLNPTVNWSEELTLGKTVIVQDAKLGVSQECVISKLQKPNLDTPHEIQLQLDTTLKNTPRLLAETMGDQLDKPKYQSGQTVATPYTLSTQADNDNPGWLEFEIRSGTTHVPALEFSLNAQPFQAAGTGGLTTATQSKMTTNFEVNVDGHAAGVALGTAQDILPYVTKNHQGQPTPGWHYIQITPKGV
jgi:hypothetical protein